MLSLSVVHGSRPLSSLLGCSWKYAGYSEVQRREMSLVQKFHNGLLSLDELQYAVARQSVKTYPELDPGMFVAA